MTYTDIFIDFDDTLYDTYGNAVIALNELYEHYELGRYFNNPGQFFDIYWQTNHKLWHQYAHGQISRDYLMIERMRRPLQAGTTADGKPLTPTTQQCADMGNKFLKLCADKPGTVEGAHQLMEYLKHKNYKLHMCSNGFHEVQYHKLRASKLIEYFDTIILSEDAKANKPSPKFFDYAIQTSKATRETTIMIGDNIETDIRGAKQAGIATIFFNRFNLQHPDNQIADYEVNKLSDITQIL